MICSWNLERLWAVCTHNENIRSAKEQAVDVEANWEEDVYSVNKVEKQ